MAKFQIEFSTDNDAFADSPEHEIARILEELANLFQYGVPDDGTLYDANGNKIGQYTYG